MSVLLGVRVSLSPVSAEDRDEFIELAKGSLRLHETFIFAPTTAMEFDEYLTRFDGVNAIGFTVRLARTSELAGFVNVNHIIHHPDLCGSLGFGGFKATAGHGYVAEAVQLVVRYAFDQLGLDRLEAFIQPENSASRRVVEKAGFQPVRSVLKVICIAGAWREHEMWAITAECGLRDEV